MFKSYRLLLFSLNIFLLSCDVKHDIILPMIDEGTTFGYDLDECSEQEEFCFEQEGEYIFNLDPGSEYMCSCNWGGLQTGSDIINDYRLPDLNSNSNTFNEVLNHELFL